MIDGSIGLDASLTAAWNTAELTLWRRITCWSSWPRMWPSASLLASTGRLGSFFLIRSNSPRVT